MSNARTSDEGVRRLITGHDLTGRSIVLDDQTLPFVALGRAGAAAASVFTTDVFPADNRTQSVESLMPDAGRERQTFCRVLRFDPGVAPKPHATITLDYAVVLSGAIQMDLDAGAVHLRQGDVLVQRGTMHNWSNPGSSVCTIFVVLTATVPLS